MFSKCFNTQYDDIDEMTLFDLSNPYILKNLSIIYVKKLFGIILKNKNNLKLKNRL